MSAIRFDPVAMRDAAAEFQGLSDYGGPDFEAGLEVLLQTYDRHVVDEAGRGRLYRRVLKLLATRLRVVDAQRRHPQIASEQITRPVVLSGLPRTGTSALFNLLAIDPAARALLQWETHYPDPIDDLAAGAMDPRRRKLIDKIEVQRQQNPDFEAAHYASADTPEECVLLQALAFNGVQLGFECLLEPYASWFKGGDLLPMYRHYYELLQMLQWREPGQRWHLKAPAHLWALPALFEVMPDACVLWGHRSPLEVIPSIASLTSMAAKMYAGHMPTLSDTALGPLVMDFYANSLQRGIASREQLSELSFCDYSFRHFVDQPMAVVEGAYRYFSIELSDEVAQQLRCYIDDNPKGKHGKHHYDYAKYGLSESMIRERFDFYFSHPRYQQYL